MHHLSSCWIALLGVLAVVAMPVQAQEQTLASAGRGPRFLAAGRGTGQPVPIDVGQAPLLRRRISVSFDGVPLREALAEISRKGRLPLMYSKDNVPLDMPVKFRAEHITVAGALSEALVDANVDVLLSADGRAALVKRGGPVAAVQGGTVVGRVTDAKTGEGIARAEVFLDGTRSRTATDTNGRYRLTEVEAGSYTLMARRLGYAKQSRAVTVVAEREDTVDVALEPIATRLQELVTTATGRQRRLEIANAVTVLNADSIVKTQPIKDMTDLLEARTPGLTTIPTTGAPGDPTRLRLRGASSITRSNDPIVIVDGVRIYSDLSEARNASLANTSVAAPSPLDRIDPNNIETVEVLNGPSAATLYGGDAANGVIVITTKRGRPGPAQWNIPLSHGRSTMPGRFPDAYAGFGFSRRDNSPCEVQLPFLPEHSACVLDSVRSYQVLNDPELTVLGQGHRSEASVGVSGGQSTVAYALTGSHVDDVGLLTLPPYEADRFRAAFGRAPEEWMVKPHRYQRWSLASRLDFRPTRAATIGLTMSLAGDEQRRANLEQQLGVLREKYVDKASPDFITGRLPLVRDFYQRTINRALTLKTGVNVEWRPLDRLTAQADVGISADVSRDESMLPRALRFRDAGVSTIDSLGFISSGQGTATLRTLNVMAKYHVPLAWGFHFNAAVGFNYVSRSLSDVTSKILNPEGGLSTVEGSTTQAVDDFTSYGWYVAPRLGNERIFFDLGLRFESGSNFGSRAGGGAGLRLPKLGGSWLISDEPFFPLRDSRVLTSLRLLAAYGKAPTQPGPTDRLRTYTRESSVINGQVVDVSQLGTLGNTRLRPERSTEIEGGVEADLFDDRLSIELTGYRKTKDDALLNVPLAPSAYYNVGSNATITINIGVVRNTGWHLKLQTNLLRTDLVQWSTSLNMSRNRNVVVSLAPGVEKLSVGGSGFPSEGLQRIVPGYPLFGYWARPILGYADANEDGMLQPGEVLLADSTAYLGAPDPDYTVGAHTTVSFFRNTVSVSASLFHQDNLTQKNEVSREGVFGRARVDPSAPMVDQALVARLPGTAALTSTQTSNYALYQPVSTFALQSLSVNWRLPQTVLRWLGARQGSLAMQGTNLGLHTNYRGKDPRVNSTPTGEARLDAGALPLPREWRVRVDFSY